MRTTITLSDDVAEQARELGVNVSAAARQGVTEAVRHARAEADRRAYERRPEAPGDEWADVRGWSE